MLKDLYRMAVFAKVVEAGSFSGAAEALGLGKSVVSTHVSRLEENLHTQLLVRTTRSLVLTPEGRRFYEKCRQLLDVAESARAELDTGMQLDAGLVRISCSVNFGINVICRLLPRFHRLHPDVQIELTLDDNPVNLVEENIDLAIRMGDVADPNLRMTRIGDTRLALCASREWALDNAPSAPGDLSAHPWIAITQLPNPDRLKLRHRSGETRTLNFESAYRTDSGIVAKSLISQGAGIGLVPDYAISRELQAGSIVRILPQWEVERRKRPFSLIYPDRAQLPVRTRALIDFLKAEAKALLPAETEGGRQGEERAELETI